MDDKQFLPNVPAHTSAACQSMTTGGGDIKCRRVCAIVVTYFPDHDFAGRMRSIGDESDVLIVWDNTPTPGCPPAIEAVMHSPKSTVLRTGENFGIASAVNRAMSWAAVHGFEWAVILDKDSTPLPGMLRQALSAYLEYEGAKPVAVIGARCIDVNTGLRNRVETHIENKRCHEATTVQTSGSLVNIQTFLSIGGYREEFFIDEVDHEFCLRARAKGYVVLMSNMVTMYHTLGQAQQVRTQLGTCYTFNYPAFRHYYMMRNLMTLVPKYLAKEPRWILRSLISRLKSIVKVVLFEGEKSSKLGMFSLGVFHGLFGIMDRSPQQKTGK